MALCCWSTGLKHHAQLVLSSRAVNVFFLEAGTLWLERGQDTLVDFFLRVLAAAGELLSGLGAGALYEGASRTSHLVSGLRS